MLGLKPLCLRASLAGNLRVLHTHEHAGPHPQLSAPIATAGRRDRPRAPTKGSAIGRALSAVSVCK